MDNRDVDIMNVYWDYLDELRSLKTSESRRYGDYNEGFLIDVVLAGVLTISKIKEIEK